MRHLWLWAGVLFLAASAFAQTLTVTGSTGWGAAVNENGTPGLFRYDVRKVIHHATQREVLQGTFHFATGNREGRTEVTITLVRVAAYAQRTTDQGLVAEFRGPAMLSVSSPRGGKRILGELMVLVKDNRPPNVQEGTADAIALRFISRDTDKPFVFRGHLVRGDIVIFERHVAR